MQVFSLGLGKFIAHGNFMRNFVLTTQQGEILELLLLGPQSGAEGDDTNSEVA